MADFPKRGPTTGEPERRRPEPARTGRATVRLGRPVLKSMGPRAVGRSCSWCSAGDELLHQPTPAALSGAMELSPSRHKLLTALVVPSGLNRSCKIPTQYSDYLEGCMHVTSVLLHALHMLCCALAIYGLCSAMYQQAEDLARRRLRGQTYTASPHRQSMWGHTPGHDPHRQPAAPYRENVSLCP